MIEQLLRGRFTRIKLFHVRLAFSEDMESVGRFAFKKVWILFATIVRIWIARAKHRTHALYYPPSGPNKVPVLRDLVLLCSTRFLFRHVIFHFHAGGVSTFRDELPKMLRPMFDLAYRRPSLAIRTAAQNPDDGAALGAVRNVVVPNGIADMRGSVTERTSAVGEPLIILFTGVLIPSKGVMVLLKAFRSVIDSGIDAKLQLMGKWGDPEFKEQCLQFVQEASIEDRVEFLGVKRDAEKFNCFAQCDIFCFPSHFEAESFGLVLVEAMLFAKPVVSTQWRGIPSVVKDEVNGFLVPIEDYAAVAEKLIMLARAPELRERMGAEGRRIFEQNFTLEIFHRSMERELSSVFDQEK